MSKIILHVDLNKFFVRCEELKNPYIVGKPVVVGGDGRKGIVSTCSYEARKYGIHSGMPTFQAKMLCKDLIIIGGDYKYYELMSKEFINYVKKRVDVVEQISIDECYCDITETYKKLKKKDIIAFLTDFQKGLFEQTKLNCSIGVASTKFLAKMGSDYKKPNGITIIRKKDIPEIIFPLKIDSYYGIGKKTAPRLAQLGYETIGEMYYALKGKGAYMNDIKISLDNYTMHESIIEFCGSMHKCLDSKKKIFDKLILNEIKPANFMHINSCCYAFANLLSNRTNVMILSTKKPWDILPGVFMTEELGIKKYSFNDLTIFSNSREFDAFIKNNF